MARKRHTAEEIVTKLRQVDVLSAMAPTSRGKRLVTICAELGTPNEFLNITVDVQSMGTELEVCERGIERAKVLLPYAVSVVLALLARAKSAASSSSPRAPLAGRL